MVPKLHVMGVVPLHVPWLGTDDTNITPLASVSVSVTPVAVSGPLFVTVAVYVRFVGNNDVEPATATPRSACGGLMEIAPAVHGVIALRLSDMGTLGAPVRVE